MTYPDFRGLPSPVSRRAARAARRGASGAEPRCPAQPAMRGAPRHGAGLAPGRAGPVSVMKATCRAAPRLRPGTGGPPGAAAPGEGDHAGSDPGRRQRGHARQQQDQRCHRAAADVLAGGEIQDGVWRGVGGPQRIPPALPAVPDMARWPW